VTRAAAAFLIATVLFIGCGSTGAPSSGSSTAGGGSIAPPPSSPSASVVPRSLTPTAAASAFLGLRLVAVGDSIPYGRQDCACDGFPTLFGDWIKKSTGMPVDVKNLSQHDNNTAARMAVELPNEPALLDALRAADIITLTIGHNDTPWNAIDDACDADHGYFDGNLEASWKALVGPCLKTEVSRYRGNLTSILDQIVALRDGRPTAIRFTTQYSDISDVPGGDPPCCTPEAITVFATVKDAFNKAACEIVEAHGGICVDVYHAFNGPKGTVPPGPLLAPDGTHPSAVGHEKIAELLEAAGLAPIR
jgi:lysophospholipase L1-like esterase